MLDAASRLTTEAGLKGATMQAIATASSVSRMTVYQGWKSRLHLLVDAYLRQATLLLLISETESPADAVRAHAQHGLRALQGDLGRMQMAVLAECLAETGDSRVFVDRYRSIRRALGLRVIRRGQGDGSIAAQAAAEQLYDQLCGTIFYRYQCRLPGLDEVFVSRAGHLGAGWRQPGCAAANAPACSAAPGSCPPLPPPTTPRAPARC